ncbi:MAG TPA: HEAT repeat domain-containing protein [Terriglobales bacterium]|nr:HEAT repeat domain-containing protein [Terriglobales bacterium]
MKPFSLLRAVAESDVVAYGQLVGIAPQGQSQVLFYARRFLKGAAPQLMTINASNASNFASDLGRSRLVLVVHSAHGFEPAEPQYVFVPAEPAVINPNAAPYDIGVAMVAAALTSSRTTLAEKRSAAIILTTADTPASTQALKEQMTSTDDELRSLCEAGLLRRGSVAPLPTVVNRLLSARTLDTEDLNFIFALQTGTSNAAAIPWLAQLQRSGSPLIRVAAAMALGRTGTVKAAPALAAALSDPDIGVRYRAVYGLRVIFGEGPISEQYFRSNERHLLDLWRNRISG